MAINNITGSPVEGEDFYGRGKELTAAWNHIKKGNSIILSAPRRVGKSSFAKKLLEKARSENWNTLEINLEEVKSEEQFVKLFIEKLQNESWWQKSISKLGELASQLMESVKPTIKYGDASATFEWKSRKTDVYSELKKLLDDKKETLIMIDELTILLTNLLRADKENGINDVAYFLNWLRSFRQVSGTKIHWVFCSSIGIDNFANRHKLSYALNDIKSITIGEFDPETAKGLLLALAKSDNLELSEGVSKAILETTHWHLPYFIQILYFNFQNLVNTYSHPNDENTVKKAYQELIDSKELNTWDDRLAEYAELESHVRLILKSLCKNNDGESREQLFNLLYTRIKDDEATETALNRLLYMLKNDGYIIDAHSGKYTFRSPLLRDFWFNRFAK